MMLPKKRHLIAFIVASVAIAIFTVLTTMASGAYEEAERFVSQEQAVTSRTGQVKRVQFAFWRRFRYGGGTAIFSFNVEGEKGLHRADVSLTGIDDVWRVTDVSVRPLDTPPKK